MADTPGLPRLGRVAIAVLCSTTYLSVVTASMASVALPDIGRSFNLGADTLSWVVTAYLITFAISNIVYGRLADMYGTRPNYVAGLGIFLGATIMTAAAPNFEVLTIGRVLQGIGAAAVPALTLPTMIRLAPPLERGQAVGQLMIALGLAFATGPLIGGWLVDLAGWRAPFIAVASATTIIFPATLILVPNVPGSGRQPLDTVGGVLLGAAIVASVVAINRLPSRGLEPLGIVALIAAAPFVALFAAWTRRAASPFIHRDILRDGRFWGLSLIGACIHAVFASATLVVPLLLTGRYNISVTTVGLWMLPGAALIAILGMASGRLVNRLGARIIATAGSLVSLGGALAFHLWGADFAPWGVSLLYGILAAGFGMAQTVVTPAAIASVPERITALGAGAYNLAYLLGGAVGVSLTGALLRRRADATGPIDPFFTGEAIAYSDALLVIVAAALIGLALSPLLPRARRAPTIARTNARR